jgi:VanZ family protein
VLAARIAFAGCLVAISWVSLLPPDQIPSGPAVSDKVLHSLGYALLGALAVASGLRWLPAVALVVGIGLVLEVAQHITGYRTFEWADLAADAAGAALGATVMSLLVGWSTRRSVSRSS